MNEVMKKKKLHSERARQVVDGEAILAQAILAQACVEGSCVFVCVSVVSS